MKRTTVFRLGAGLAVVAFALTASGGGADAVGLNNLTVKQQTAPSSTSGHTKVYVDVKNVGDTASGVSVTGLLKTTSGAATIAASGIGWTCAPKKPPTGWQYKYICTVSSIAADTTSRLTLDLAGTVGAGFTNFVTVGEQLPGETTLNDNTDTIKSYFGPRADLRVIQSAGSTATTGHVIVTTRTTNRGPSTANALQLVIEVKASGPLSASFTSKPSASCQTIPPATGYTAAFSCVLNSLAPGATWKIVADHQGPAGTAVQIVSKATANTPTDPVPRNNTATTNTTYHG
jgi:hypothetical protein